jgi:hypothetical protein
MLATAPPIMATYSPRADTYAAGRLRRCSVVDRKRVLRTSPFEHSRKFGYQMHYVPLPVNVAYVPRSLSQRLRERMEWLAQWIRSHPFLAVLGTAFGTVFAVIIGPIVVHLFLLYIGNPFAAPDLTVDPNFYPGYEGHAIQPPVIVHNAGDATAEHCVVKATNMRNQEEVKGTDVFSVSPGQGYLQRLVIPVPNLPKTPGKVKYRIRVVCSNDVSAHSTAFMYVY